MYIIIVGGGRLGYYLTRALIDEEHEVLVIEKDASFSQIINNELGSVSLHGDGCEAATLEEEITRIDSPDSLSFDQAQKLGFIPDGES